VFSDSGRAIETFGGENYNLFSVRFLKLAMV
jgi:hypothetical protein